MDRTNPLTILAAAYAWRMQKSTFFFLNQKHPHHPELNNNKIKFKKRTKIRADTAYLHRTTQKTTVTLVMAKKNVCMSCNL